MDSEQTHVGVHPTTGTTLVCVPVHRGAACTFAYLCLLVPTHAIHELLKNAVVVHFPYAAKCKGEVGTKLR